MVKRDRQILSKGIGMPDELGGSLGGQAVADGPGDYLGLRVYVGEEAALLPAAATCERSKGAALLHHLTGRDLKDTLR